jgi:hypothetical protein
MPYVHQTQTTIGLIAAIVEVAQSIPYYASILRGRTHPERATYGIWAAIEIIEVSSYIASGATTTKWVPLISAFNSIAIFALSLKRGMGGHNKLDLLSLALAGGAIALWVNTGNPVLAVYMSVSAAAIGYVPTIRKAYKYPKSENTLSWSIYVLAATLNIFALTSAHLVIVLPLVYTLICSSVVAGLLLFPKKKLGNVKRLQREPRLQEM